MTVTIDVTASEEAWLAERAAQQGVKPSEIIKQLIDAQLPSNVPNEMPATDEAQTDPTAELFARWAEEDAAPGLSAKSLAAIAYMDARIEEGTNATPEERRVADLEIRELLTNLKANREISG